MKFIYLLSIIAVGLYSCNNLQELTVAPTSNIPDSSLTKNIEPASFFPVTDYLLGQMQEIKRKGVSPLKIVTIGNKTDSEFIQLNKLQDETVAFFNPVIDSNNLAAYFEEKKFLDQTINAFTFTYDPLPSLPDSFPLRRWDVYIDPENNTVKRIYILKKSGAMGMEQLTWTSDNYCKMVSLDTDSTGKTIIVKVVLIKWEY